MISNHHRKTSLTIIIMIILIMISFLWPFLTGQFSDVQIKTIMLNHSYGLASAWVRTVVFSIFSSVLCTLGGLQLAICFRHISISSPQGKSLALLMLPIMMGDVMISYIFKCILYDTRFFGWLIKEGWINQTICILLIQAWEYCFLFAYLFWLAFQNLPKRSIQYLQSVNLTEKEKVKDLYLPSVRNLFVLLSLLCFIFSFYEFAKCQYVFKFSQGTNTEFLSQALYRIYHTYSVSHPQIAQFQMERAGFLIMVSAGLLMLFIGLALVLLVRFFLGKKTKTVPFIICSPDWLPYVVFGLILLPIVLALVKSQYGFDVSDIQILSLPFLLTLLSALFATLYAISFGIASKIILPKKLSEFHSHSIGFFLMVFILQFIPPICQTVCGYKWLSVIGYHGFSIYFVWVMGHAVLTFPILGSFVIATHFALPYRELDWQFAHQMSYKDLIRYDFYKRFRLEYILTYVFACVFIWNDTILNQVLSDDIPSFSDKLQRSFVGRAADDSMATLFALTALFSSILCFCLWLRIINKNTKKDNVK